MEEEEVVEKLGVALGWFEEEADGVFGETAVLEGVHGGMRLAFGGDGASGFGSVDAGLMRSGS